MILADYHIHTTYCDGKNTPREMIEAAVAKGFSALGFSVHAYTHFDTSYCIRKEDTARYLDELSALKEEYRRSIRILIGAEVDAYADTPKEPFDYLIGSAHYVRKNGRYFDVDASPEITKETIATAFQGDGDAYAEAYFEALEEVARHKPAIIGHFDLLTKFDETETLIDTASPRYRRAWQKAADTLLLLRVPFEINTGAISRGWRTTPYPSGEILTYLLERGATFLLSGDAHSTEGIGYRFDEAEAYAHRFGVKELVNHFVQF